MVYCTIIIHSNYICSYNIINNAVYSNDNNDNGTET